MSRILVVNPNTSARVTDLIGSEARRVAAPGTELVTRTASYGVEYIETRLEAAYAATAVAEIIAAESMSAEPADAVLVAAFGDPGLPALKELVDVPVVGISEAAFATASLLGRRFSIIAITKRLVTLYRECVELAGLEGRLASIHSLTRPLSDIGTVRELFRAELVELAARAVEDDGADVIIMAGAPLAGLARQVGSEIRVPVLDGVGAGVKQCEALIGLRPGRHRAGSFARPPLKARVGLTDDLERALNQIENN